MKNTLVHEVVLKELEESELHPYISQMIGGNVHIVSEDSLYGVDPKYTNIFDKIAGYEAFRYSRTDTDLLKCKRKNLGEIASLAYATYHGIHFIASNDQGCFLAQEDISELGNLKIFGSEVLLYFGYDRPNLDSDIKKRIKALYKNLCDARIKRRDLPSTFNEYRDMLINSNP